MLQFVLDDIEIQKLIGKGRLLIIYEKKVYDLTKWKSYHPGGELALVHMNGKDATDAITALHPDYVFKKMNNFCIGEYGHSNPQFEKVSKDFRAMNQKIKEMGLYRMNPWFWVRENIKFAFLYSMVIYLVAVNQTDVGVVVAALILGFLWHQVAFVAHDSGHNGVSANRTFDTLYGMFLADFIGGLSIGWWKLSHYVHHIITNDPEHDPDIQHLPFFSVSPRFVDNIYSTFHEKVLKFDFLSRLLVPHQHRLYYIVLAFGRFNLYVQSWVHVFTRKAVPYRALEITFMLGYWAWFLKLLSILPTWGHVFLFILVSHVVTMILHLQITLSHFGMSTEYPPHQESWAEMQLRTSMDVDCPRWMDWFHGGLQFQVEHHLFPRVPRHNLRAIQPLVKEFARKHEFKFYSYTFTKSNIFVLGQMKQVADQISAVLAARESHIKAE